MNFWNISINCAGPPETGGMYLVIKNTSVMTPEFVQLTIGRTRLLFPRSELLALEATPETGTAGDAGSIGIININDVILSVYNFDEQLQLLGEAQDNRRNCACLGDGNTAFGIMCEKAEIADSAGMQIVNLPACMLSANTPVQALAMQGTRILCICGVERIARLINVASGVQCHGRE